MSLQELSEQEILRRESLQKLRQLGIDPYPAALYPVDAFAAQIKDNFEDGKQVCLAGRMLSQRIMGKASFAEIQDASGRIQVYFNRDELCPTEDKTLYNEVFKKLLDLGDFFVVTTGGTAFYGVTLEIGDTIYANQNITVNSNPAQSVYTVVIQDQNVAGEGASDGATQKGVAGFDSATFSVTSNGFVTSDIYGGGSALGVVPSGGASTTFLKGNGTWAVPANDNTQRAAGIGLSLSGNTLNVNVDGTNSVAANASSTTASRTYKVQVDSSDKLVVNVPWVDTNTQTVTSVSSSSVAGLEGISVTPTTGAVKVGLDINGLAQKTEAQITFDESYVVINDDSADLNVKMALEDFTQLNTFVSGTITSYGAITHGLGSFDVMVQIYDETTKDTIQMAVERNSTNQITLSGTGTFPTGGVIVLVNRMR